MTSRLSKKAMIWEERVFCAIDTADFAAAENLARRLGGRIAGLKLGSEFFCAHGPRGVERLAEYGAGIFLDLKFHDIPHTVLRAVEQAARLPIRMLTLHASGGPAMMRAALEAARHSSARPEILAVTVLTSLRDEDMGEAGISGSCADQVERLSSLALASGVDGIVCSPREIGRLRQGFGDHFRIVTPGIRPSRRIEDDQRRTATLHQAIRSGADYVVIGRPITAAADPARALGEIVDEPVGQE